MEPDVSAAPSNSPEQSADLSAEISANWQQGKLLELTIEDLNHSGEGVGRWQGRVVFVPDTVPGDQIRVRLVRVKPQYAQGKLHELITASQQRVRPACIVADKCGGCQWQQIDYAYQLQVKRNLLVQNLERIGGFEQPAVEPMLAAEPLAYRNKATYPVKLGQDGSVQAGYYQKGSHFLINLNQCPIQDVRLNPYLTRIKLDIQKQGWQVYDETTHRGEVRHLSLRVGRQTGEVLLTIVGRSSNLPKIEQHAQKWLERYPDLVGVCLNINAERTNAIFGAETRLIAGRGYLREQFAGLEFQIQPTTFFQVNTQQAEALVEIIRTQLNLQGDEVLVDAYCGVGTLTLPLSRFVKRSIGIESQQESIEQARVNAAINQITNAEFQIGKVEALLPQLAVQANAVQANIILLDPPRKGCDPQVIATLLQQQPQQIAYVSCNPATLARDLKLLSPSYQLIRVQPADFFPQTAHVEAAAFLSLRP
ncbi:MAG: 23S rRNA (uracil(1939)-C(5))-methyltransferase RlmD [Pegethrix bostrychoides GSE-TBD4-15B]|jgi:23S rRNA (uracil1939-C5)-methyltransferase|uniref:23S rRNA (Uracil(1939)-C(5))-methyltransferase RlmD n=1 Tax=Pegethrix bostrychoides GSE-TBD4-15B TaxID=2839662 RepID=A0A951PFP3_9CYAN|nr:23S rRNA (uracil(1939)-C(5))-methyltransferase RlmD [Pegethrix bostrychoides GSE-TBD4-15B]